MDRSSTQPCSRHLRIRFNTKSMRIIMAYVSISNIFKNLYRIFKVNKMKTQFEQIDHISRLIKTSVKRNDIYSYHFYDFYITFSVKITVKTEMIVEKNATTLKWENNNPN